MSKTPEELRKEQEERRKELILKESDPPSEKVERELKNAFRL
jgi:hypothetical protein